MIKKPLFFINENKAIIPWKEYIFTGKHFAFVITLVTAAVILASIQDKAAIEVYFIRMTEGIILASAIFYFLRHLITVNSLIPMQIDMSGITAPTLFHKVYIPWSTVTHIEYTWSIIGPNMAPVENNLVVKTQKGTSKRLFIPELTPEEKELFCAIIQNISRHHGFTLSFR